MAAEPAQPPEIRRRMLFSPVQAIGVPLLALLPILALLGVFDEKRELARARGGPLEVEVDYPVRVRHLNPTHVVIAVRNTGSTALDEVRVELERSYIQGLSEVDITPEPEADSGSSVRVALGRLAAGETRRVSLEAHVERASRHGGEVRATGGGADARTSIRTFVLP